MTIQYASDLHLEFIRNEKFVKANPLQKQGNILLLAGDIVPFAVMDKHKGFFNYISDNFVKTYWVPGNHEYYGFDIAKRTGNFKEDIKSNVHLVNNIAVTHNDTRFVFSTLWSKISPGYQWQIERSLSDFRLIKYDGFKFSADRFNELHEESLAFITHELANKTTDKTVVVTHHVPTLMNYPAQYKGSIINEAFATELSDLIETNGPDAWIYGHHHAHVPDFTIGKTRLLTNQLGYVDSGEHLWFDTGKVVFGQ
jgi:predicted phosphohydrolase